MFDGMYSRTGRPSTLPERLLRAQILIALYRGQRHCRRTVAIEMLEDHVASAGRAPSPSTRVAIRASSSRRQMRLMTGFAGTDERPNNRLAFDFAQGTVRGNAVASEPCCGLRTVSLT